MSDDTDCDDADATIHPMAPEVANDGIDQDCDGVDTTTGPSSGGGAKVSCSQAGRTSSPTAWLAMLVGMLGLGTRRRRPHAAGMGNIDRS